MMIGLLWPGCFFFDKPLRSAMSAKTMTTMSTDVACRSQIGNALAWHSPDTRCGVNSILPYSQVTTRYRLSIIDSLKLVVVPKLSYLP
jgi:hypothetical protein